MSSKRVLLQYGVSLLAFGLALLLTHLLWPVLEPSATTLFFAAVMVAAFYGGLGPGLLVSALSALAIDYYFVPPFGHFEVSVSNVARAAVFLLVAFLTSWLNASRKRLMESIRERDREREKLLTQISGFNEGLRREVAAATVELTAANNALLRTQQRLARSERMAVVGQMAASLAHEIGTPLNAISGHMELLAASHPDHADSQRRIEIISRQLDFIVGIVRRLLEWTHERQLVLQPVDLNALVREVFWLVSPALEKGGIKHELNLDEALPTLRADRDGLQQVFLNLVNNSADAMPHGGRITVSTRLDQQTGSAELLFRDTGTGIDPETLEHLFEPMWTTKASGGGFGLSIAHEVVAEHGGQIEARSDSDAGATFRITLPLPAPAPAAAHAEEVLTDVA
jgi:two-component system NtrC family sensor kinase